MEVKVSSISKHSHLRSFYYSNGKKIKNDARHLLLGLLITEENDKYWKIEKWTLVDLAKLTVHLKTEFNASNMDIYKPETISSKIKIILRFLMGFFTLQKEFKGTLDNGIFWEFSNL